MALVCATYADRVLRDDEQYAEKRPDYGQSNDQQQSRQLRKYYTLTPLFVFSMLLVAVANNLGVMWVAMEGTTLASIFLVTFYGKRHFSRGRLEVRDHRRRGSVDGAVRHRADLLFGTPGCSAPTA